MSGSLSGGGGWEPYDTPGSDGGNGGNLPPPLTQFQINLLAQSAVQPGSVLKPFTIDRTIACIGDSISAHNSSTPTFGASFNSNGFIGWAQFLLRNRIQFDGSLNFGVAGDTTTQMMVRLPLVVAAAPSFCTVLGGTNDYPLLPVSTTIANLQTMITTLAKAGIRPIWFPILPRGVTGTNKAFYNQVNWVMRNWCRKYGYIVCDCGAALINPVTGDLPTSESSDNLHPNTYGAYLMGQVLAATLDKLLPVDDLLVYDPLDTFDAVNNPFGCLIPNPLCTGTTGTKFSAMTGNYLTSWTSVPVGGSAMVTGGTVVGSKTTPTDGIGEWQRVDFAGVAAVSNNQVFQFYNLLTINSTNGLDGKAYQATCDFQLISNTAGLNGITLATAEFDGNTYNSTFALSGGTAADPLPAGTTFNGILRTPPTLLRPYFGTGTRTFQTMIQVEINGPVGATFSIAWRRASVKYLP